MSTENNFDAYYTTTLTEWIIILRVSFTRQMSKKFVLKRWKKHK